jgi:hypothetical protein
MDERRQIVAAARSPQARPFGWNRAAADTEAGALDRAKHFIALGYPVRAITDRSGAIYMDEAQIAARFGDAAAE